MHYITVEDFFEKAAACKRLSREEERACATAMDAGDSSARERLVQSYLPSVAGHIRRCLPHTQTLKHLYSCLSALEKAVDSFNFLQLLRRESGSQAGCSTPLPIQRKQCR